MNRFYMSNLQHQYKHLPSSISLLSDHHDTKKETTTTTTTEMNQSYYERKRINDEYIESLRSFIHDVEERKCEQDEKNKMYHNTTKIKNDPWDCLLMKSNNTTSTTTTTTTIPGNFPIIQIPVVVVSHPHHPQQRHDDDNDDGTTTSTSSLPALSPKIDQKRIPLTSHKIPPLRRRRRRRRRNVVVSTLWKYYQKLQQKCHRRHVPSSMVFATTNMATKDITSSSSFLSYSTPLPKRYPSKKDLYTHTIYPEENVPLMMTMNTNTNNRTMNDHYTSSSNITTTSSSCNSVHSDTTWVVSNQTSVFC